MGDRGRSHISLGRGRRRCVGVAVTAMVFAGCSDPQAGAPVAVEVAPPDRIDAVEVGDVNAQEPFVAAPANALPNVTYEFVDDLELPNNTAGYVYRAGSSVDPDVVQRLADYLDLDPSQVQNWDELATPQSDQSGTDSASVPTAGLGYNPADALQQWTYADYDLSDPYRNCQPASPNESAPDACASRAPSGVAPTADEAESKLTGMLDQIEVTHGPLSFQSYADQYGATTNAVEYDDEGLRTGREWSASYGGDGALISATGPFAIPERVGPYDLVDLATAKQRVETGVNSFGSMGSAVPGESSGAPSMASPTDADGAQTVRIVSVAPDLLWIWDADNNAWLVPAFAFRDAEGGVWSVPAVPDDLFGAPESVEAPAG